MTGANRLKTRECKFQYNSTIKFQITVEDSAHDEEILMKGF